MPGGNECPACGENISIWAVYVLDPDDPAVVGGILLGSPVLGGAAVEVVFVLILWYGRFRLESVNRPKNDWDEF